MKLTNNGMKVYENEYCTISYKDVKNEFVPEDSKFPVSTGNFMIDDIITVLHAIDSDIESFLVVYDITTKEKYRNQGHGVETLKEFVKNNSDRFIAAKATVLKKHYPKCPSDDEMKEITEKGYKFLQKVGFVDINNYCNLEFSVPCVYPNDKSKEFLERINTICNPKD